MSVRLIGVTQSLIEECDTAEELIVYAAKVSNPTGQANLESADKLISYLIKNNHWSPFEMASATIEITTTRDIARQILRHRSFSFQEFSQRYAEATEFVMRDARLQDKKNRQNSIETSNQGLHIWWEDSQDYLLTQIESTYKEALERGIAKEQARAILPEGCTVSKLYMQGTIRSWIHYCQLRCSNGTQAEHMDIAKNCWKALSDEFPIITGVLNVG